MIEFLKRLFGTSTAQATDVPLKSQDLGKPRSTQMPGREPYSLRSGSVASGSSVLDEYFKLSGVIESAKSAGDFSAAIRATRDTFPLMPAVVAQMKKEYGAFDIATSHAVHTGGTLMAVMEDSIGIRELRETLSSTVDLRKWLESAKRFGISETQLKNHTRCVAISSDKTRFLVTIVDEAWCYETSSGRPIWGLRLPAKEGWN
jgi:hypothetical protein